MCFYSHIPYHLIRHMCKSLFSLNMYCLLINFEENGEKAESVISGSWFKWVLSLKLCILNVPLQATLYLIMLIMLHCPPVSWCQQSGCNTCYVSLWPPQGGCVVINVWLSYENIIGGSKWLWSLVSFTAGTCCKQHNKVGEAKRKMERPPINSWKDWTLVFSFGSWL